MDWLSFNSIIKNDNVFITRSNSYPGMKSINNGLHDYMSCSAIEKKKKKKKKKGIEIWEVHQTFKILE